MKVGVFSTMEMYDNFFNSICRICLSHSNSENMVSLINNSIENGLSSYGKAVLTFANISIENDCLPSMMCHNCLCLLKQAIIFKKRCEESHRRLTMLVKKSKCREIKEKVSQYVMFMKHFAKESVQNMPKTSTRQKIGVRPKVYTKVEISVDGINTLEDNLEDSFQNNSSGDEETNQNFDSTIEDENILLENIEKLINMQPESLSCLKKNNIQKNNMKSKFKSKRQIKTKKGLPKLEDNIDDVYGDSFQNNSSGNEETNQKIDSNLDNEDFLLENIEKLINMEPQSLNCFRKKYTQKKVLQPKVKSKRQLKIKNRLDKTKFKETKTTTCKICNKVLANVATYKSHMERHTGCRFVCEHCGKRCATNAELQYHQAATHGMGPFFICNQCGYKAPRKYDLKVHLRLHTGERPYACDKCGLTFQRRFVWKKHAIYHMEKTIQCTRCPRKFFRRGEMLAHVNNVHERVYVYACSECDVTYAKTGTVRRHLVEKHGIAREAQGKIRRINLINSVRKD